MKWGKGYGIMGVGKKEESGDCGREKGGEVGSGGVLYWVVGRWVIG